MADNPEEAAMYVKFVGDGLDGNDEDRADDPIISLCHKDEIVKTSVSRFNKFYVSTVLKFIFKNKCKRHEILSRSNVLSRAVAISIAEKVMKRIKNDVPEQRRSTVDLGTVLDSKMIAKRNAAVYATPGKDAQPARPTTAEQPKTDRAIPPKTSVTSVRPAKQMNACHPPLPHVPPHNNLPTWKNVPLAPTLEFVQKTDDTFVLTWNMKKTYDTEPIQFYELYYYQETDAPRPSGWRKLMEIKAGKLPMHCEMQCLIRGYAYHFALRAVDAHGRRAPFGTLKISVFD